MATTTSRLTPDQGKAVGREDLVDGLEVGGTAAGAVAGASRGDTLGLGAGVEGPTRVTGLGADVGLGEAGDTALGIGDRGAQGADGTAVDAGGGAGAADAGAGGGRGAAGDGLVARAVAVDGAAEGGPADGADVAHVGAAGEDRAGEGSERGTAAGGGGAAGATAVAGRDETSGDREAERASESSVDDVGVTTDDRGEGGGHRVNGLHLELGGGEADLSGQRLGVGSAVGESLNDELVGGDVDVVRGNASGGRVRGGEGLGLLDVDVVKSQLSVLKLGEAAGDDNRVGASGGHLGGQGGVSDGDVDHVLGDPSAGERVTGRGAQQLDDLGGLDVPGDTSSGLLGVQSQVALHGGEDLRVEAVRSLGGGTVGNGQDGCQEGEEPEELHV